jgi:glycosyltransferase involved in cell wall biosynthesis
MLTKLSIVTINYNNKEGLEKTIVSVVNQKDVYFEYIIIDGGSTDGSIGLIKQYIDRITFWVSEPDNGIYHAMNKGIHASKGEYLLFLNSGDFLSESKILNSVVNNFASCKDLYYGKVLLKNFNNTIAEAPRDLSASYFFYNSLPHSGVFFKRKVIECGYDEKYRIAGDYALIMKLLFQDFASYQKLDQVISIFDMSGVSNNESYSGLQTKEREIIFLQYMPSLFKEDVLTLMNFKSLLIQRRFVYLRAIERYKFLRYSFGFFVFPLYCMSLLLNGLLQESES